MLDAVKSLRLQVLHMDFVQLGSEWQYNHVISPFSRLYLITAGEGWVFHNEHKYTLKPGYLYLIPSFTYSRYHCDTYLEQYFVHILDVMEGGLSIFDLATFCYECPANELDRSLMARLLALNSARKLTRQDPKAYDNRPELLSFNQSRLDKEGLQSSIESQGILLQLFARFLDSESAGQVQKTKTLSQLGQVLQYIHTHLDQKLTVEQLAAERNMNVDYFSRKFLELVGVRPVDYIISKRLERAQLLLTTTDTSLKEIAELVGISNIYYFSRLFKGRFGVPPSQYRKTAWQV